MQCILFSTAAHWLGLRYTADPFLPYPMHNVLLLDAEEEHEEDEEEDPY